MSSKDSKNISGNDVPVLEDAAKGDGTWLLPTLVAISLVPLILSGTLSPLIILYSFFLAASAVTFDYIRYTSKLPIEPKSAKVISFVGYHFVLLLFLVLIAGIGYPYVFLGLVLIFLSNLWYGRRGVIISLTTQVIILSFVYLLQIEDPSFETFAYFFSTVTVLVFLSLFLNDVLKVAGSKIVQLGTTETEVKIEHTKINSLINSMGDGVIVTNPEGKIINYNGASLELIDTNTSIKGKKLSEFLRLTDKEGGKVDLIADARKHNRTINRDDLVLNLSKNDKINLYVNISPIRIGYGEGSEQGYTLILRDITNQKSLEEERDEFISVVSHELRTPVAITEGKISNAMLMNERDEKDRSAITKSLNDAHDQTKFLAAMINDLSTLARAERGALDMEITLIQPANLLNDIRSNYKVPADQKGLELIIKTTEELVAIDNSSLYIQEILQNFVTNSLKYTKTGSITISARNGKKPGTIAFSVKDTGIGISTSDKKHLFDKFFRSEDYRTRESTGTGLGLHIAKKLADKIGGQIDVRTKLNQGSTFTLTVGSLKTR